MSYILRSFLSLALLLMAQSGQAINTKIEPDPFPEAELTKFPPSPADHMRCYKILGDVLANAVVDLDTPQYGISDDCRVGRALEFCVPTSKEVEDTQLDTLRINAQPQPGDLICYQLHCYDDERRSVHVADQFGKRTIETSSSQLLCVPAVKLDTPKECGFDGNRECGGACEQDGQECRQVQLSANEPVRCLCVDTPEPECGVDAAGQCGGDCRFSANLECRQVDDDDDNDIDCRCLPKPEPCAFLDVDDNFFCPAEADCSRNGPDSYCGVFETFGFGAVCRCSEPCAFDAEGQCGGGDSDDDECPGDSICGVIDSVTCGCVPTLATGSAQWSSEQSLMPVLD